MGSFVVVTISGPVAELTFNSPEDRNALSRREQCEDVAGALRALNADPSLKVAILTGAGSSFCAGGNIKDMQAKAGFMAGEPAELGEGYRHGLHLIPLAFQALARPIHEHGFADDADRWCAGSRGVSFTAGEAGLVERAGG